jgi:hypothetical protein
VQAENKTITMHSKDSMLHSGKKRRRSFSTSRLATVDTPKSMTHSMQPHHPNKVPC